jgi:hypothetical protein
VTRTPPRDRDRGAVDVSIEMLVGMLAVIASLLLVIEAVAYWHARNVFDDAAADGARIAAAYDGSCAAGIEAARSSVERQAGSWADGVSIECTDGPLVVVTITGTTPGVVGGSLGVRARASQSAPSER